ncbi:MAG: hypothetical protein ABIQ90_17620 [Polaromonas sp.]
MASSIELTPQERLAISRRAIVRHMNRHHREVEDRGDDDLDVADESSSDSNGTLSIVKHALREWWNHHPASAASELARPLLSDYAKDHAFKLLCLSAAVGAAAVVIRPWRMVSVGALLVAAVKSSGLTSSLITMISSVTRQSKKINPTP